jgi:hypothetical protein
MILKGSQRGGPRQLATHLLNVSDNDHVTLAETRGFVADDLFGAMAAVQAVSKGTKCRQPIFSLSLSPPKEAEVSTEGLLKAIDRAETALGLEGQPRAVVVHEKDGRKHAHAVWSRIDGEAMKAINLPFFKSRLNDLSKELYLENGWELPEGHRTNGWKNPLNFTLAEWQQAKRLGLDPREVKQVFQSAWSRSDNLSSFRNALEEHGYYLARGDRRGIVALDLEGNVFSVSRWSGVRTKELNARLGKEPDLPGVEDVRQNTKSRITKRLKAVLGDNRKQQEQQLKPLTDAARRMTRTHRAERALLNKKQDQRLQKENKMRAAKFRRGLGIVLDVLSGRLFTLRRENEREAFVGYLRDRAQREQLVSTQLKERAALQIKIDLMRDRHRTERQSFAARLSLVLQAEQQSERENSSERHHGHDWADRGPSL